MSGKHGGLDEHQLQKQHPTIRSKDNSQGEQQCGTNYNVAHHQPRDEGIDGTSGRNHRRNQGYGRSGSTNPSVPMDVGDSQTPLAAPMQGTAGAVIPNHPRTPQTHHEVASTRGAVAEGVVHASISHADATAAPTAAAATIGAPHTVSTTDDQPRDGVVETIGAEGETSADVQAEHDLEELKALLINLKLTGPGELLEKLIDLGVESVSDLAELSDEKYASLKVGLKPVPAKKLDKLLLPEIQKQREIVQQQAPEVPSVVGADAADGGGAGACASVHRGDGDGDGDGDDQTVAGSGDDHAQLADATTCMEAAYADSSICRYDLRTVERMLHILGKSLTRLNSKRHVLKGNEVVEERWDHMREVQQQQLKLLKLRKKQLTRDNPEEAEAIAAEAEEEFSSEKAPPVPAAAAEEEEVTVAGKRATVCFINIPEEPKADEDLTHGDLQQRRKEEMERLAKLERSGGNPTEQASSNVWTCKTCQAVNEDSTTKCRVCFTLDPQRSAHLNWQCADPYCRHTNPSTRATCWSCGLRKPTPAGKKGKGKGKTGYQLEAKVKWKCHYCHASNDNDRAPCKGCGEYCLAYYHRTHSAACIAPRKGRNWDCTDCDVTNNIGRANCAYCGLLDPGASVKAQLYNYWICGCQTKNPVGQAQCSYCPANLNPKAPEPEPVDAEGAGAGAGAMVGSTNAKAGEPWQCKMCHIKNPANVSKCGACFTSKPGSAGDGLGNTMWDAAKGLIGLGGGSSSPKPRVAKYEMIYRRSVYDYQVWIPDERDVDVVLNKLFNSGYATSDHYLRYNYSGGGVCITASFY